MASHGSFSGNPKTEWLANLRDEDRDMKLLEDFSFTDPAKEVWLAPKDAIINGASIPRPLWSTVGSPYTDDYRRASVVHDVACNSPGVARKDADVMFFHACRAGGCGPLQARILYAGVRIGAWVANNLPANSFTRKKLLFREGLAAPFVDEQFVQRKLSDIAVEMQLLPDEASIGQLDAAIAKHIKV